MNIIDMFRIKRDPNIIDSFHKSKINNRVISYAIKSGYSFNPETLDNFISFSSYRETFKDKTEVFESLKQQIINGTATLRELYNLYDFIGSSEKKDSVRLIKSDEGLAKFVVENLEVCMQSQCITLGDVIQIIDGRDDLANEVLENDFDFLSSDIRFREFAEYIAQIKTPEELSNMKIRNFEVDEAFIKLGKPENVMQLCGLFQEEEFLQFENLINEAVLGNIEGYLPYLEQIDKAFLYKARKKFLTKEIRNKVMDYLKGNNILYSEAVPQFALNDEGYIIQCLIQDPTNILKMQGNIYIDFNKYSEEARQIADKIETEKIKFEGKIPSTYLYQRDILEKIVSVNTQLLNLEENRHSLHFLTYGMTDNEVINYYIKLGVPFNRHTVIESNFLSVIECLRNDHMSLADTSREYTEEEYRKIFEELNGKVKPEEVLQSRFLTQNPYFVAELLQSDLDLRNIDFRATRHYEKFYLDLKAIGIKNGISIPEPKKYQDIIKFTEEGEAYVHLNSTESVKKGLEYIKKHELNQDLLIMLNQEEFDEFIITDNIEFFEELAKNNININFQYSTGKKKFSLQDVLFDEHFLQTAVEDIKSKNFSPLEQLIAVYDIAKVFKAYKKGNNYISESRALYEYLNNEYMVCAGYSNLIANLGHRLGASYSKIGLKVIERYGNLIEGHARNYVNLVDSKYGIDGFYTLDATWEQSGALNYGKSEAARSTYQYFLLTTEQGRKKVEPNEYIDVSSYDEFFTCQTPEELRACLEKNKYSCNNNGLNQLKVLDPEFYEVVCSLDLSKDEDANIVLEYLKTKVNKSVKKEALLDAIMTVKKSIYVNFTDKDFEDMKMGYSITPPFRKDTFTSNGTDSLYGDKYDEYLQRRYQEIKHCTIDEAKSSNPCLLVPDVISFKSKQILVDNNIDLKYSYRKCNECKE